MRLRRRLWCAVVGCPEHDRRAGFTPDGQQLPDWLSWSQYVTIEDGRQMTTGEVVDLPLTYYGPSIPLGNGWSYGGLESPRTTSEEPEETSTPEPTATPSSETTSPPSSTPSPTTTSESSTTPSSSTSPPSSSPPSSSPSSSSSLSSSTPPSSSTLPSSTLPSSTRPSSSASPPSTTSAANPSSSTSPPTSSAPSSSTSGASPSAVQAVSLSRNLAVILPSILVPLAVLAAFFLLVFCLRRRRNRSEEKRTAAYRRTGPRWAPVSTTDPPEKPGGVGAAAGSGAGEGVGAGAAAVVGAGVLAAGARGDGDDNSSQSSHGDERSSLLHRGSVGGSVRGSGRASAAGSHAGSTSGLAGVGTAMGAVAAATGGIALLRSLGLGKRPRTESPTNVDEPEGTRNVSGNTMERMIGLVKPNRYSKQSSSGTSGGHRSGSGGTHTTTTDAKRSSGGTSTSAYVPVPDEELFYAPQPIMDRSADSNSDLYHSANSNPTSNDYDPGTVGTAGSNSSSGHSRGSKSSKSSSSKSSRGFRGAGGRVHSTIMEESGLGGAAAFAGGDLGLPETPTSASFSVYDSAGSGSGDKDGQDLGDFGTRASGRGSRLALPTGSAAGRYSERNSSVGTFGTPFDQDSTGSSELLAPHGRHWVSDPALVAAAGGAAAAGALPWGAAAARRQSVDSGRSPFASLESTNSGHRMAALDARDSTPRTRHVEFPAGAVGMVPLEAPISRTSEGGRPLPLPPGAAARVMEHGHRRSGSQEMMAAAAHALEEYRRGGGHQRSSSQELPERNTPSPVKHSRNASASRALLTPLPGLNRPAPGPILRPLPLAAGGGDMMLSPFGPPPAPSHGSGSGSHPSTGPSMPSAQTQNFVFPPPPGAAAGEDNWSVTSRRDPRHSGTTASADGSGRRGSAPKRSAHDEFGVNNMQGAASRSAPTLVLLNSPQPSVHGPGNRESYRTSDSSGAGWEEVGTVQRLGQAWNTEPTQHGRVPRAVHEGDESSVDPFAPVEPVTPERARRGEFGSPRKLMRWLKR